MKNPDTLETLDGKHRTKTNKTIDTKHDTVAACDNAGSQQYFLGKDAGLILFFLC
jgi:hypothetical protein